MTWIGLADVNGAAFDLNGLQGGQGGAELLGAAGGAAQRGTILLEAEIAHYTVPRPLIQGGLGASFQIAIAIGTRDNLDFRLSAGGEDLARTLSLRVTDEPQTLKVSYAWDVASGAAVLSVYQPQSNHLEQVLISSPKALPWAALRSMMHEGTTMCRANQVAFLAISKDFEPAGPMPGLTGELEVSTPLGPRPIRDIAPGDWVLTGDGRASNVLASVSRSVPARGSFTPYLLRAPYLGLERDVVLSAESYVQFHGSDVEYLLGVESVLGHAGQVGEKHGVGGDLAAPVVTYYQLVLPSVEIMEGSASVCSMNFGSAAPDPIARAATLWADVGDRWLLQHGPNPHPVARQYEIVTLNAARAA
ncbi:MAG: Hint domain-containing protein [Pseudomonadota bacterium]